METARRSSKKPGAIREKCKISGRFAVERRVDFHRAAVLVHRAMGAG